MDLTDKQIESIRQWCFEDVSVAEMCRQLRISCTVIERVIRENRIEYESNKKSRGARAQIGIRKIQRNPSPKCIQGCICGKHKPKSEETRILLCRPKKNKGWSEEARENYKRLRAWDCEVVWTNDLEAYLASLVLGGDAK